MQRHWPSELWLPTIRPDRLSYHEWKAPKPEDLSRESRILSTLSTELMLLSHHPSRWVQRGSQLLKLGYSELALGDAYKARLLIDTALAAKCTPLRDRVRLILGLDIYLTMTGDGSCIKPDFGSFERKIKERLPGLQIDVWTLLIAGLKAANAYVDQIAMCKQAVRELADRSTTFMLDTSGAEERLRWKKDAAQSAYLADSERGASVRNGSILSRPYPWMTTDLMQRPDTVVDIMQKQLEMFSEGRCTARKSNIQNDQTPQALGEDVLGVYALRDIAAEEEIFVDKTATGVTSVGSKRCELCCGNICNETKCPSCAMAYCSEQCLVAAFLSGHLASCGSKAVSYTGYGKEESTKFSRTVRSKLLRRYLEIIVQHMRIKEDPTLHPLQVLSMMRLTPKYTGDEIVPINYLDDIVHPISMLQRLGIDVFTDFRYDTWVLFTMRFRLNNNVVGITIDNKDYLYGVFPMMAILNHSCDPSVRYSKEGTNATITLTATRDIAAGEEIFTSYLGDTEEQSLTERRQALMAWLGTTCKCSRCLKEERWKKFGKYKAPQQTLPTLGESGE